LVSGWVSEAASAVLGLVSRSRGNISSVPLEVFTPVKEGDKDVIVIVIVIVIISFSCTHHLNHLLTTEVFIFLHHFFCIKVDVIISLV
jgi:hypothetical protein